MSFKVSIGSSESDDIVKLSMNVLLSLAMTSLSIKEHHMEVINEENE